MNKNIDHFPKKISINYMGKKSATKTSFYIKKKKKKKRKKKSILFEGITKLKFGAHSE